MDGSDEEDLARLGVYASKKAIGQAPQLVAFIALAVLLGDYHLERENGSVCALGVYQVTTHW